MSRPTTAPAPAETVCRAATFPFTPHGMTWQELAPLLARCWGVSTRLANWAMTLAYRLDQEAVFGAGRPEKLPPMLPDRKGGIYLYGHLVSYPDPADLVGIKQAVQTTLRAVRAKYKAARFDVLWRRAASLPSFRYPYPFAVHNKDWRPYYGPDNVPLVEVLLPGGRVTLRLRGGPEMGRQLAAFRQIVGGAKKGELALYRKGHHEMVKLVAHFPLREKQAGVKTMLVRTDPNALWVAEMDGAHARVWNQDHVRSLVERHRVWLQRVSEDTKREKRVPRAMRRHIDQAREARCRKQNDRLDTFCHEMSAQLAQFAARQGVGVVLYDDANKAWLLRFPWHRLREKLRYKLEALGITFLAGNESAEDEDDVDRPEPEKE